MNTEKLRSIIRESINEYIKDIDEAGTKAMYEAKMKACDEAIEKRMKKIEMAESLEEMQGMFDESKMKDLKTEIKALEKQKAKYGKMLEKLNKGKEVVTEEPVEEAPVDEADITAEMDTTNEEEQMEEEISINESFLKMQKLAGVITEAQYNKKKNLTETQLNESSFIVFIPFIKGSDDIDTDNQLFGVYTEEELNRIRPGKQLGHGDYTTSGFYKNSTDAEKAAELIKKGKSTKSKEWKEYLKWDDEKKTL